MEANANRRAVMDIEDMSSADMIRTLVHLAVANREEIEGYKKTALVYETEYGICLVPRVLIRSMQNGDEVYGIGTDGFLTELGVTKEELYEIALANSAKLYPAIFLPLGTAIGAYSRSSKEEAESGCPLFVLMTGSTGGAVALFYDGMMDMIADQLGCSYYCIPSSVHEWLIVPLTAPEELNCDSLRTMVREINANGSESGVGPKDKMSDEVYMYDMHRKKLVIAR